MGVEQIAGHGKSHHLPDKIQESQQVRQRQRAASLELDVVHGFHRMEKQAGGHQQLGFIQAAPSQALWLEMSRLNAHTPHKSN